MQGWENSDLKKKAGVPPFAELLHLCSRLQPGGARCDKGSDQEVDEAMLRTRTVDLNI